MAVNITIDARKFASPEAAIRKFRRVVDKSGVIKEHLAHTVYVKPSDRKRRKRQEHQRLQQLKTQKMR